MGYYEVCQPTGAAFARCDNIYIYMRYVAIVTLELPLTPRIQSDLSLVLQGFVCGVGLTNVRP